MQVLQLIQTASLTQISLNSQLLRGAFAQIGLSHVKF
jgi:hypothetical protein